MKENDISFDIRGSAFRVYNELGPGLLESVYERAMAHELENLGYMVRRQVGMPMVYKDIVYDVGFRMDLLVNNLVIVEVKSVEELHEVHFKQVLTYLKLSGIKLGLLINFNSASLNSSIKRIVNNL